MDEKIAKKVIEVNCISHWGIVKEFLPSMLKENKGQFVFVSSAAGIGGFPYFPDYCASKFACVGFSESLRC